MSTKLLPKRRQVHGLPTRIACEKASHALHSLSGHAFFLITQITSIPALMSVLQCAQCFITMSALMSVPPSGLVCQQVDEHLFDQAPDEAPKPPPPTSMTDPLATATTSAGSESGGKSPSGSSRFSYDVLNAVRRLEQG